MKSKLITAAVIKIIVIIGVTVGINIWLTTLAPVVANDLALNQMTDAPDSGAVMYLYTLLTNYLWAVPVILTLLLFIPEVILAIKYLRRRNEGNEEDI